ncbi:MAG: GAF domain-containing protein [Gammaproteobacteria bacterium]|nr:GAF domain-containing protein [Gammaproteobacteria bacterium]
MENRLNGSMTRLLSRSPVLRILVVGRLLVPFGTLLAVLIAIITMGSMLFLGYTSGGSLAGLLLGCGALALSSILVGASRLRSQLLKPLAALESAVADVCEGGLWSTLPLREVGVLGPVTRDLDSLSGELIDLYEDMDNRVARQTRELSQQTASLKILYDVAAKINQVDDMEQLLLHLLQMITKVLHGRSAVVQLVSTTGQMRLVGSIDQEGRLLSDKEQLPVLLCQCGKTLSSGDILCDHDEITCSLRNGRRMYSPGAMQEVVVPLKFHGDTLGMFRVYVPRPAMEGREDLIELCSTIGNHLGIAIAKQRSDEEAHRLSIIEERTALANELHDSLAQTLASLRYQVRMLEETLEHEVAVDGRSRGEIHRIRSGLDEAHTELRELLNSFRAPLDQRGLMPALEKLAKRFRQETGIPIFLQCNCRNVHLGTSEEMQMLRIVQESLANIRKHAHAKNVRILLNCNLEGEYLLLVEDDGVGFVDTKPVGNPGEHIGLSIMGERAKRLGATFRIESEPGEGTRVELTYKPGPSHPASAIVVGLGDRREESLPPSAQR